jgi:NAD(P)H-hydrate epimerase
MVRPWKSELTIPDNATALAVGPGLAADEIPEGLKATVTRLWRESPLPMIVDASALTWLRSEPIISKAPRVVTPHPGEAAGLLAISVPKVLEDRPAALREISQKYGRCYVVLKGHQTLVGRAKEELYINSSGNPYLAQGGSGDLLTGFLGGLLAQPALSREPLDLLRYGVWQHGAAADLLQVSRAGWTIENLADMLGTIRPRSRN